MSLKEESLLKNENFIVFGEDFGRHAHSLEHLLRPLFSGNRFIWVETIGIRSPRFSIYDLKRIFEKLKKWFAPRVQEVALSVPPSITIVRPLMIPFNQFKAVRLFNTWSVRRTVHKVLRELNISEPITVASVPNAADYIGQFKEKLKVYFCVDEFSLWPGLNYTLVKEMEELALSKSDLVFATAQALAKTKTNNRRPTLLLTHGVDMEHFQIPLRPVPGDKLRICYFGLFDERSDQEIWKYLSENCPEDELHIIGNSVCDTSELQRLPNIQFHGPVPYRELPQAIADMDVFVLPYVRSELTENINPLKLKEYLSTGRPVIATALPEVAAFKDHLLLGDTGADFVEHIKNLKKGLTSLNPEKTLIYLASAETWMAKAQVLSQCLRTELSPASAHHDTNRFQNNQ